MTPDEIKRFILETGDEIQQITARITQHITGRLAASGFRDVVLSTNAFYSRRDLDMTHDQNPPAVNAEAVERTLRDVVKRLGWTFKDDLVVTVVLDARIKSRFFLSPAGKLEPLDLGTIDDPLPNKGESWTVRLGFVAISERSKRALSGGRLRSKLIRTNEQLSRRERNATDGLELALAKSFGSGHPGQGYDSMWRCSGLSGQCLNRTTIDRLNGGNGSLTPLMNAELQ